MHIFSESFINQNKRDPLKLNLHKNQQGQMVVEYVLLLVVAVTIAFTIRMALVKKGETAEESGAVLKKWQEIQKVIAEDDPNKRK